MISGAMILDGAASAPAPDCNTLAGLMAAVSVPLEGTNIPINESSQPDQLTIGDRATR
jgi:hypothetical protein